jgi:hypothetical protein
MVPVNPGADLRERRHPRARRQVRVTSEPASAAQPLSARVIPAQARSPDGAAGPPAVPPAAPPVAAADALLDPPTAVADPAGAAGADPTSTAAAPVTPPVVPGQFGASGGVPARVGPPLASAAPGAAPVAPPVVPAQARPPDGVPAQARPPDGVPAAGPVVSPAGPPLGSPAAYHGPAPFPPPGGWLPPAPRLPANLPGSRGLPVPLTPQPPGSRDDLERTRRTLKRTLLAAVLGLLAFVGVGGGVSAAIALRPTQAGRATFVDQLRPEVRDRALADALERRATAVKAHDKSAFLADVYGGDAAFRIRQETTYENLTKLPLAEFGYGLHPTLNYQTLIPDSVRQRYHGMVRAPGVTVRHRIDGVDDRTVSAPWVPIFALIDGRWWLVGEATDKSLPLGAGGQAWDGGQLAVVRSRRVVGVFSADHGDNPNDVLLMSEQALDRVALVRPGGWTGRILLIAVRDRNVFDTYFGRNPDRVGQVAAIAVPYYTGVADWDHGSTYAATRIIFNPDQLSAAPDQLSSDLVHEFTHAAMAPVTTPSTPTWLVEGFAEYVSYRGRDISASALRQALRGVPTTDLVAGDSFYETASSYVTAWLACRMIAERFGEARLMRLYEAFRVQHSEDAAVREVLGISRATLVKQWQDYVDRYRG